MLDWLRRKIGCVSSHEEILHAGITANNINRFKVVTDSSLMSECNIGERSGILEVNDDELIHYQSGSEPIRWSYRCLRRYGHGNDTFLFESGRRCTTGPGLFAFKCRRADILHNVFTEKLRRFATNRNGNTMDTLRHHSDARSDMPNRYSDDVMLATSAPASMMVDEEPYLTPISPNQVYINCNGMTGESLPTSPNYINTAPTDRKLNGVRAESGSSSSNGHVTAVREINYAELDLPKSDAIGFAQEQRKSKSREISFQYVNIEGSSDEDEAFLPPASETSPPPYMNIIDSKPKLNGSSMSSPTTSLPSGGFTNPNGMNGQTNGWAALPPTPEDSCSGTQYTTIDFQKTAAIASTAKSTQSESSQEGMRKTRHDSSADDLH